MADAERPRQPPRTQPYALRAPCVQLPEAAAYFNIDLDDLVQYAEAGLLPPWVAQKLVELPRISAQTDMERWRFAISALQKRTLAHFYEPRLWLHRMSEDDSDLTQAWLMDHAGASYNIRHIAEWCRVAIPDPLRAAGGPFAIWCSDHNSHPNVTAGRYHSITAWFDMLRSEGSEPLAAGHIGMTTHLSVASTATI